MLAILGIAGLLGVGVWLAWENWTLCRTLDERTVERDAALLALERFAQRRMTFTHAHGWYSDTTEVYVRDADETTH
jgi:hypothetical protein